MMSPRAAGHAAGWAQAQAERDLAALIPSDE